jgi:hypothetical protein
VRLGTIGRSPTIRSTTWFWRRAGTLLECLDQLPSAQKTAFLLHHEDGIALDEPRALDIV